MIRFLTLYIFIYIKFHVDILDIPLKMFVKFKWSIFLIGNKGNDCGIDLIIIHFKMVSLFTLMRLI